MEEPETRMPGRSPPDRPSGWDGTSQKMSLGKTQNGSSPGPRGNTPYEDHGGSELARNHRTPLGGWSGSFGISRTSFGWLPRDPLGL
jgi:hypothetical protein